MTKTVQKKNWQETSQQAAPSISAKTLAFSSLLYTGLKYTICPLKNPIIEIFSLITHRKKISAAEILEHDRS